MTYTSKNTPIKSTTVGFTSCPKCGSNDNMALYEDGSSWCFTPDCKNILKKGSEMNGPIPNNNTPKPPVDLSDYNDLDSYGIGSRGISKETVEHFGVKMEFDENRKPLSHLYPYTKEGKLVGYKRRQLPKSFTFIGNMSGVEMFGQAHAKGKHLVITEGELDCLAMAEAFKQKMNKFYAVVSIPSASTTKILLEQREWLNTFESVVIMFDNDDAGKLATEAAAKIIGAGKCKVAKLRAKDPCEELTTHGSQSLIDAYYAAKSYSPAGILVGEQIWDKYIERNNTESIPYPPCLGGLNDKIKGMRQGEITLLTSGTGSGKSTITKEIMLHLINTSDSKVGIISLEESIGDTAEQLINMHLKTSFASATDVRSGFDDLFKEERIVLLDHQGSVSDASLTDKIEYMALMGCTHLFLDHITIAVSEGSAGLSGNEAVDKMMSDLLKITKKHNIWLGLVSHLRKAQPGKTFEEGHLASIDDIKGSGSIKQISFDIIAFARNLIADDETEKNTVKLRVLKSRFTGLTGDAGAAIYDRNTGRLTHVNTDFFEV